MLTIMHFASPPETQTIKKKSLFCHPCHHDPAIPSSRGEIAAPLRGKSASSAACWVWDSKVLVLWAVWQPLVSLGFISHTWCSFVEGIGRDFAFLCWDDMSLCLNLFHMTHLTWSVSRRFARKGQGVFQLRLQKSRGLAIKSEKPTGGIGASQRWALFLHW